jgi:glucose-1-phosphate thymidylyltransferase
MEGDKIQGLIAAGGHGSRLHPLTRSVNKHLLGVYDKPMIYYPLAMQILAGLRSITVVSSSREISRLSELLGDGSRFGISISYAKQDEQNGIVGAILAGLAVSQESKTFITLGDNFFFGSGLVKVLSQHPTQGASIFTARVENPYQFGILEKTADGKISRIVEKPENTNSNLAITGNYIFDETLRERSLDLLPSARGELEITDLLNSYRLDGLLFDFDLPRGVAWMDMGTPDDLAATSRLVETIQDRQGMLIGSPEEAAFRQDLITKAEFEELLCSMPESTYRSNLQRVLLDEN